MSKWDQKVDYNFLKGMGVKIVMYKPWQIGLFCEELQGKFVWYPKAGTLMYDDRENGTLYKVGKSGQFCAGGNDSHLHTPNATEMVYNEIINKIYG